MYGKHYSYLVNETKLELVNDNSDEQSFAKIRTYVYSCDVEIWEYAKPNGKFAFDDLKAFGN